MWKVSDTNPTTISRVTMVTRDKNGNTVEAPVSVHPRKAVKMSATGAGRLRECVNIQGLYELEFKRGFVKTAVGRAVRLQECPLRKLRL